MSHEILIKIEMFYYFEILIKSELKVDKLDNIELILLILDYNIWFVIL